MVPNDMDKIRDIVDAYMTGRETRIKELETQNWGAYGFAPIEDSQLGYAWLLGSTDYDQELNYLKNGRGREAPWLRVREQY